MNKEAQKQALREVTAKESQAEANRLRFDFDEAIKEAKVESIEISYKGKIYELPSQCPASLLLEIIDSPESEGVIAKMIGKKLKEEIMSDEDVPLEALTKLIGFIKDAWNFKDGDSVKNALTPNS